MKKNLLKILTTRLEEDGLRPPLFCYEGLTASSPDSRHPLHHLYKSGAQRRIS